MYTKINVEELSFYQALVESICHRELLVRYGLVYSHDLELSHMNLNDKYRSRIFVNARCHVFSCADTNLSFDVFYHALVTIDGTVCEMLVRSGDHVFRPKEVSENE